MPHQGRPRRRSRRAPHRQAGAAGPPPQVRRLVVPQGQARPGRARRRPPRSARWPRRPGCGSGSGPPLAGQRYPRRRPAPSGSSTGSARVVGDDDVSGYARQRRDRRGRLGAATTRRWRGSPTSATARPCVEAMPLRRRTHAVRGAAPRPGPAPQGAGRATTGAARWPPRAVEQARALVPVLAAYGVDRLVTSSSTRCVDTVAPYADGARAVPRGAGRAERGGRHRGGRGAGRVRARRGPRGAPCCAPTARCCRWSSTRSASPTRRSRPASCWSRTSAGAVVVATERHLPC